MTLIEIWEWIRRGVQSPRCSGVGESIQGAGSKHNRVGPTRRFVAVRCVAMFRQVTCSFTSWQTALHGKLMVAQPFSRFSRFCVYKSPLSKSILGQKNQKHALIPVSLILILSSHLRQCLSVCLFPPATSSALCPDVLWLLLLPQPASGWCQRTECRRGSGAKGGFVARHHQTSRANFVGEGRNRWNADLKHSYAATCSVGRDELSLTDDTLQGRVGRTSLSRRQRIITGATSAFWWLFIVCPLTRVRAFPRPPFTRIKLKLLLQ